jgi:hypothetical protein
MTGTAPNGQRLAVYALLMAEVSPAGKIAKLYEYLDSAALAALRTA